MATLENNVFTLNKYTEAYKSGVISPLPENAGWFGGGWGSSPSPGPVSIVSRISYFNDNVTTVARGPLSRVTYWHGSTGNSTDGWFGGGGQGPPYVLKSIVDRIIFTSDSAIAVAKGPLSSAKYGLAATGNTTDGWFGGAASPAGVVSTVDRVIFASDTATATAKGPLSGNRYCNGATGTSTDGWFGGGYQPNARRSTVDRVIFASDKATAVAKGPLSLARQYLSTSGTASPASGWFGGGFDGPYLSTIDRIIFASDTATASARGPLDAVRGYLTAV